jgi:DNA invertase Pin-like site-specific DNA recombinase
VRHVLYVHYRPSDAYPDYKNSAIYGHLRASTADQDATRAKSVLEHFITNLGHRVSSWFVENESGATLKRPELFRLLNVAQAGDILLVEQVDRMSRLNEEDWKLLKTLITEKNIIIVALDLPTSHQFINHITQVGDEFTRRMLGSINGMLLDMLAAIARKDYEDRRRRQGEGIEKARLSGKYKGRPIDETLHQNIASLLKEGCSINEIVKRLRCSNNTVIRVKKKDSV